MNKKAWQHICYKLEFCLQKMLKYKKAAKLFLKTCVTWQFRTFGDTVLYSQRVSPSIWMATYDILIKKTFCSCPWFANLTPHFQTTELLSNFYRNTTRKIVLLFFRPLQLKQLKTAWSHSNRISSYTSN